MSDSSIKVGKKFEYDYRNSKEAVVSGEKTDAIISGIKPTQDFLTRSGTLRQKKLARLVQEFIDEKFHGGFKVSCPSARRHENMFQISFSEEDAEAMFNELNRRRWKIFENATNMAGKKPSWRDY